MQPTRLRRKVKMRKLNPGAQELTFRNRCIPTSHALDAAMPIRTDSTCVATEPTRRRWLRSRLGTTRQRIRIPQWRDYLNRPRLPYRSCRDVGSRSSRLESAPQGAPVPFITAGFDVRFLRPTPLGPPLSLRAEPVEISESAIIVSAELAYEGKVRATMVANWLRFHPG